MSLLPQAALAAGTLGALGLGLLRRPSPALARALALAAPLAALLLLTLASPAARPPLFAADLKGLGWQFAAYLAALPLALRSSGDDVETALFLGTTLGIGLLCAAANLPMLFLGLEFMSLPAYLLVARVGEPGAAGRRLEAAVKYFFSGALAGALFLFGLALYYADAGTLGPAASAPGALGQGGLALMAAAALFKIGAVPLHWWLPDVYEACAPEVAGFLSTAVKAAAVLFLMRVVELSPAPAFAAWLPAAGALTALVGAVLALRQEKLQRLLACSSLAHAGFLVLGVGAWERLGRDPGAAAALLFYLVAYVFMSNGAFAFLGATGARSRADLRGLAARRPREALAMTVLLFALAGVPPTGGFLAKLLVFWQAVRAELAAPVLFGALAALISLGYYLGLMRDLYFEEPVPEPAGRAASPEAAILRTRHGRGDGNPDSVQAAAVLAVGALGAVLLGAAPLFIGGLWP
ncbi:MAG: NADH-quinone oxidoreductase subunit N [Elusimicrobia bacterium]|nr:NADH-quinone oxidoreductase subunit N [Elusimicrobiota bacterium]